ncbi:MAG: undecaprenyl-diphosphate phosphatase [bacterium]
MDFYYCILLSFIQAITEFLPVSSSGHLLFLKGLFKITELPIIFDIIVHVASLCAILIFYSQQIKKTIKNGVIELMTKSKDQKNLKFIIYIIISTAVTFMVYIFLKEFIESKFKTPSILSFTFLMTSFMLFSTYFTKNVKQTRITDKNYLTPIIVGIFQGLAILPGISRSGATISSLLLLRTQRKQAAYYSFFLAIPAILGALIFKLTDMSNINFIVENLLVLVISFLVGAIFSYIFLKILIIIINKGKFWIFSIYTIILSLVSFIIF